MSELRSARMRMKEREIAVEQYQHESEQESQRRYEATQRLLNEAYSQIQPELLSVQQSFFDRNVPIRLLKIMDEAANEIAAKEDGWLKGSKLDKSISFYYLKGFEVSEDGSCDNLENAVNTLLEGNGDLYLKPVRVSLTYSKTLKFQRARETFGDRYEDYEEYEDFILLCQVDGESINFDGNKYGKTTNDLDEFAEGVVGFIEHARYRKSRSS